MSVPLIESIAANLATTIDGITVANGYQQTLTAVRPRRNDFSDVTPTNGKVLISQAGDSRGRDDDTVGTVIATATFVLEAMVIDADETATAIDTRLNQVYADLHKALMGDHTRGGYAIDTYISGAEFFYAEGLTLAAVTVEIQYRTLYSNPYTAA